MGVGQDEATTYAPCVLSAFVLPYYDANCVVCSSCRPLENSQTLTSKLSERQNKTKTARHYSIVLDGHGIFVLACQVHHPPLSNSTTMDLFTPLLLLSIVTAIAHVVYGVLNNVGGWYAIAGFATVFILCQRWAVVAAQRKEALHHEVSEWVIAEMNKLYRNERGGSAGEIFASSAKLFTTLAKMEDDAKLEELTRKKDKFVTYRPFDQKAVSKITKSLGDDMTFNSNAIEGNKITARETRIILAGYLMPRFRKNVTQTEFYEIIGHDKARKEIVRMVNFDVPLTVEHLLTLHKMILCTSDDGGILRSGQELALISGVKVLLAPPTEVRGLVNQFLEWLAESIRSGMHPFLLAVTCQCIFVRIYPFRDGNGRMARLLMNLLLLRAKYPALVVLNSKRNQYMDAIHQWENGNAQPLTKLVLTMLNASFDKYFAALGVTSDSPPRSPYRLEIE
jgi:Fic/DOC family